MLLTVPKLVGSIRETWQPYPWNGTPYKKENFFGLIPNRNSIRFATEDPVTEQSFCSISRIIFTLQTRNKYIGYSFITDVDVSHREQLVQVCLSLLKLTLIQENCMSEKHSLIFKDKRKTRRQYRENNNHKRKEKWILFIEGCSQVWNDSAVVCQQFDNEFITKTWKHILSSGTTIIWISRFSSCKSEKSSRYFL